MGLDARRRTAIADDSIDGVDDSAHDVDDSGSADIVPSLAEFSCQPSTMNWIEKQHDFCIFLRKTWLGTSWALWTTTETAIGRVARRCRRVRRRAAAPPSPSRTASAAASARSRSALSLSLSLSLSSFSTYSKLSTENFRTQAGATAEDDAGGSDGDDDDDDDDEDRLVEETPATPATPSTPSRRRESLPFNFPADGRGCGQRRQRRESLPVLGGQPSERSEGVGVGVGVLSPSLSQSLSQWLVSSAAALRADDLRPLQLSITSMAPVLQQPIKKKDRLQETKVPRRAIS